MTTSEIARVTIRELVEKFHTDPRKGSYNEQQTREYYILPLFRALGWDTQDPSEFTAEEQISRGFVDFGFYRHGVPIFYLETKRVAENLENPKFIRQAINYAYLRGVTWAVLCDFEQLLVYNAQWQGTDLDKVRFLRLDYTTYADENFDDLWLLSKPAFANNLLDRKAEKYGKKATREPVTQILFRQLTDWRKQLFNEFRAFGGVFAQDSGRVDNAVQRLIDRLIFIRSMEDRGIEQRLLQALIRQAEKEKKDPYTRLRTLFTDLDGIYNSNIFAESDLDHLKFSDAVLLKNIIEGLYGNQTSIEYDFNAISADVLGAVYEQYLSFKAQDPQGEQSAKNYKRKSQGIYYTPQFIVRYIVQNTLGEAILAGANPLTMRVIDPACGSGSFLIEAFDFLFRQLEHAIPDANQRREHILTHNLYGVDLDVQAVEVTRLNLLLRAAYQRRLLPPLTHIKHGDSLVTPKFDYHEKFPDVFADGGFDVVIGNPPYVRQETLGTEFKVYAVENYKVYAGTADLYVYFIERGLSLLKDGGRLGYILPNKWMRANYGAQLRQFLADVAIDRVIDFGDLPVFADATTYPSLLFLRKDAPNPTFSATNAQTFTVGAELAPFVREHEYTVERAHLRPAGWSLAKQTSQTVLAKLMATGVPLGEYVKGNIYYGIKTGFNEAFVIDEQKRRELIVQDPRSADVIKPFLTGRDIKRYETPQAQKYLISFPNGWTRAQMQKNPRPPLHGEGNPHPPLHGEGEQSGDGDNQVFSLPPSNGGRAGDGGRIATSEGNPHPLTPSPLHGEGEQSGDGENKSFSLPLQSGGRAGDGGRIATSEGNPHPLTPSPLHGEGEQSGDGDNQVFSLPPSNGGRAGDGGQNKPHIPAYTSSELWSALKPLARQMRHEPTHAEKHLWGFVRKNQIAGKGFRRQHPIDRFIVDFYCHEARLVVEVDGEIHQYTQEEDAIRQAFLESLGLRVLRFTNEEVLHETMRVIKVIEDGINNPHPLTPSPLHGEGEWRIGDKAFPLPPFDGGRAGDGGLTESDAWAWLSANYPAIAQYLTPHTERAKKRTDKGEFWWELRPCAYYGEFDKPKIIYSDIAIEGKFTFDANQHRTINTLYMIIHPSVETQYYLLGILNSSLFTKMFSHISPSIRGGYLRWFSQYMEKMPIPLASADDRAKLAELVQRQLAYHAELAGLSPTESERRFELLERIGKTDSTINAQVAGLYGIDWQDVALLG